MKPRLFVFTGIDGAGKTTHAKLLAEYLNEKGISTKYVHLLDPNFRIGRWIGDKFNRKILNKENEFLLNKKNKRKLSNLLKGFGLLFLFRGIYQSWIKIIMNRNYSVIVFDRYAYDDFVRVAWKYGYSIDRLSSLIRLVPQPDITFHLILPPREAWRREKEGYTDLEQHTQKGKIEAVFSNKIKKYCNMVDIDVSTRDVEEVQEEIRKIGGRKL